MVAAALCSIILQEGDAPSKLSKHQEWEGGLKLRTPERAPELVLELSVEPSKAQLPLEPGNQRGCPSFLGAGAEGMSQLGD